MSGASPVRLMLVTDAGRLSGRSQVEIVSAAIAGGVTRLQVRERSMPGGPLLRLVEEILAAAKGRAAAKVALHVNDRLDIALAAGASGVHLPAAGLPVKLVRQKTGARFRIGRSVHSVAEARAAQKEGADEVIFGPIFATPEKAVFGPPQGIDALRKVLDAVRLPVWAIGGITPATAVELKGLPIAGVAAIGAFATADDPARAARDLLAALSG
ncbi:MAG TPA: thiamine phosphate synthase [Candidatus Polarisedimenticolia bacterium]|nr:thiamine phosphate synthase [Candidatus Polarisedimenticolia bacterium]